jgi:hypothetical protein
MARFRKKITTVTDIRDVVCITFAGNAMHYRGAGFRTAGKTKPVI